MPRFQGQYLPAVYGAHPITDVHDLNDLHVQGCFSFSTMANAPDTGAYIVIVVAPATNTRPTGVHQTVIKLSTGTQSTRIHANGAWTAWEEVGAGGGGGGGGDFDPAGTADAAIAALLAEDDPFTQYLTSARGDAAYDALGAATAAVSAHVAASDPHTQYLTVARGDALYDVIGAGDAAVTAFAAESDPFTQYLTAARGDARYDAIGTADAAVAALSTVYQPLDADLGAIAALTVGKGKVIVGTAAGWAALAAGTDGDVLTLDSTQTDGVKWHTPSAGGGGALTDGDYGDIIVSGSGTALNFDTSVVTAFAKTFLDDANASAVRATLGVAIGTDVQAHDADLDTWATLTPSANFQTLVTETFASMRASLGLAIGTDVQAHDADLDTWATFTPSANFQTLITETFASMRSSLGLVIGTDVQAHDADLDALAAFTHTKGNILVDTGTGWALLAVGSNGNVLTADSTQTDGIHWVAPAAGVEIDASGFPTLTLKNTTSVGAAENVGTIAFAGDNAASTLKTYASISGDVSSAVASAEAAALSFETMQAGALATRVSVGLGLYSASASGGDKGVDTANFTTLYEGGVAISTKYALGGSGTPGRNRLINPMGRWFQAGVGTSVGTDGGYSFDQWYSLVQTVAVNTTALTAQENGMPYAMRFRQASTTQRWGFAQVLEADESLDLHGKACTFGGRLRCTNATTLRFAVIGWTGTANVVTRDIVLDWTNGTFTAGSFFTSTSTVVYATGSISVAASTYTDFSLAATIGTSCNNVIVFVWTDSTQASTCDLDASKMYFNTGGAPAAWEPPDLGTDLARCMRFYEKSYDPDEAPGTVSPSFVPVIGATIAGTLTSAARTIGGSFTYDVTKIKIPTVTIFSNSTGTSGKARDNGAAADVTAAAGTVSRRGFEVEVAIGSGNTSANLTCCWVADGRL